MTSSRERPTRQRLSADHRRRQILQATTLVIARAGYANTSLTEITEIAGISKGLLWHYFADRSDLMRQTVFYLAAQLRESVTGNLDLSTSVPDVIRAVLVRTALFTRTHSAELKAINQIVHNSQTNDGQQLLTVLDYEAIYVDHERLIRRGQREGSIRKGDIRVMVVSYQGVIDATIGYLQMHPELDPASYAGEVAELFLSGANIET